MTIFESLDAFRAHCGDPTMPIEQCPICSKIPPTCSRKVVDDDVTDDRPPEVLQLEALVGLGTGHTILRCPTCHRLYFGETTFGLGYFDYHSTWTRYDVDALFQVEWCVTQRLPEHRVSSVVHGLFRNHAIVRFEGSKLWHALDGNNRLVPLDGKAALVTLIDRDPPRVTGELDLARRYAWLVDEIENPDDRRHDTFQSIVWRDSLTPAEQRQVDAARVASRVEALVVERAGEHVNIRYWVTSQRRLICRTLTVQPDGHHVRQDAVVAENLPIALESLDR